MASTAGTVIAIDPGRDKCGFAAVAAGGRLLKRSIVPTPDVSAALRDLRTDFPEADLIIGDGTGSEAVSALLGNVTLTVVPEAHTTDRALELWRDEVQPTGWRRLLPRSLRFPPGPIDDYAAWVLARDYLETRPHEASETP